MLACRIDESQVKDFMNKLLKESVFDDFQVRGIELTSYTRFEISGAVQKEYFEETGLRRYCTWEELRPVVFFLIKSYKRPKSLKIIFSLAGTDLEKIHPNATACFLNILYEGNQIQFTATATEKSFSMDKTVEIRWSEYIKEFFNKNNIFISTLD